MFKRLFRLATGRSSAAADAEAEVELHLALAVDDLIRRGYSAEAARAEALRRFGDRRAVETRLRESATGEERRAGYREWLDGLRIDMVAVGRGLRRTPLFTLGAVATLAVAIGLTAAIFSVFDGVLLRPLPYRDPGALVRVWSSRPARGLSFFSVSEPDFRDWRSQARSFSSLAAFERHRDVTIATDIEPLRIPAARISADLFQLLGTMAAVGRSLQPEDDRPGAPARVVVLSHGFWLRALGGAPDAVGRPLVIDGEPYTVVGVMPRQFVIPGNAAEVWTPLGLRPGDDRSNRFLRVLGRLNPGVDAAAARAELTRLSVRLDTESPATNAGWRISLMPLTEAVVGRTFGLVLGILLAGAGLVLVVACVNVALMLLGRNTARAREVALRMALGAGQARLLRLLAAEGIWLGLLGGLLGSALGLGLVKLILGLGADRLPRLDQVALDPATVAGTIAIAIGCGVVFSLAPSRSILRRPLADTLREGAPTTTRGWRRHQARNLLVVVQVALAVILVAGAGVLARSLWKLESVELGFDPAPVLTARLALPEAKYPDRAAAIRFYDGLLTRLAQRPGVASAAVVSAVPLLGPNSANVLAVVGRPVPERGAAPDVDYRLISPDYFTTVGVVLVRGRGFIAADDSGAARVAVIDEAGARQIWPGGDVLGARIRLGDLAAGPPIEIVGVVRSHRYGNLEAPEPRPLLYLPVRQTRPQELSIVVKARSAPEDQSQPIRAVVHDLDPELAVGSITSLSTIVDEALSERRFNVVVALVLAGVTLLLAISGLYGVMSAVVSEQTRELGIRMALGAERRRVVGAVLGRSLGVTLVGVVVGLAGVVLLNHTLASLLYHVAPTDMLTLAGTTLLLGAAALFGAAVPARRAARLDPLTVLRQD